MEYHSSRNRKGRTGLPYGDFHPSPRKKPAQKHEKHNNFTQFLLWQTIAAAVIVSTFTVVSLLSGDWYKQIRTGLDGDTITGTDMAQAAQDVMTYIQDSETFSALFPDAEYAAQGDSMIWTSEFLAQSTDSAINDTCVCPIQYTTLSSAFGQRSDPFSHQVAFHNGWDMAAPTGTPVVSAWRGTVRIGAYDDVGGYYIIIDHDNQLSTYYGHLSSVFVVNGQQVLAGETIGLSGNTGKSTGPHLHFEIKQNNTLIDPARYLDA